VRRIAIVGSRSFTRLDLVEDLVSSLPYGTVIISGGAVGVDRTAEEAGARRGLMVLTYRPEWKKYGRRAGIMRNRLIVEDADEVYAFWNGESQGTASSIKIAKDLNRPVHVIEIRDDTPHIYTPSAPVKLYRVPRGEMKYHYPICRLCHHECKHPIHLPAKPA
jgi:predicted Rossmann fold nucleotide-binding protein DprA/Smf involved in DNA uptake